MGADGPDCSLSRRARPGSRPRLRTLHAAGTPESAESRRRRSSRAYAAPGGLGPASETPVCGPLRQVEPALRVPPDPWACELQRLGTARQTCSNRGPGTRLGCSESGKSRRLPWLPQNCTPENSFCQLALGLGRCDRNGIQRFRLSAAPQLGAQTGENAANCAISRQAPARIVVILNLIQDPSHCRADVETGSA